jgi:hypothetical protein
MRLQPAVSFFLSILGGIACGDRSEDPSALASRASDVRLIEDLRIGSLNNPTTIFGDISAIAINSAAEIFILDFQSKDVRVFDTAGAYLRTIGRQGAGPGELGFPLDIAMDAADRLWVMDLRNNRYSIFASTGELLKEERRTVLATAGGRPLRGRIGSDGSFSDAGSGISGRRTASETVFRFDATMALIGQVALPPPPADGRCFTVEGGAGQCLSIPFGRQSLWTLDGRGHIYVVARSDEYRIAELSPTGDTLRIIMRDVAAAAVQAAERDSAMKAVTEQAGGTVRPNPSEVPSRKPFMDGLFVSANGEVWVRRVNAAGEAGSRFDVFDGDGLYLGTAVSELTLGEPIEITGDMVYAGILDDAGVPYVVRLRIVDGA